MALKRKVRDTIGMAAQASGMDPARYQIFVEAEHALNTRLEQSYAAYLSGVAIGRPRRTVTVSFCPVLDLRGRVI